MNSTQYQLVYEGKVQSGHDAGAVRDMLVELFELADERRTRLFAGEPVVLSRGMDSATANTFKQVLEASGALSQVVEDTEAASADNDRVLRSVERRVEVKRRAYVRSGAIVPDRRDGDKRRQ